MSSGWTGPTSPITSPRLEAMTVPEIVEFLRTWEPSGEWRSASPAGLGRDLAAAVEADPSLIGRPVTVDFARQEIVAASAAKPVDASVEDIQRVVCHHFKLRSADLISKDRHKSIALRKLGLRDVIISRDGGYYLDPRVEVLVVSRL